MDDMQVYIANLGKYNEGELVGAWFTFPIDFEEVKEKCKTYDNLIEGIAAQSEDDKEPIINLIDDLISIGKELKEKSKNQDRDI